MSKAPRALRPKDTFDTFWAMINLNGPKYWKVSKTSIDKTSAPAPHEGPVISFDENFDYRAGFPNKRSLGQAGKHFLQEYQEKCCVFAGSKYNINGQDITPYYGTPLGRVESIEHKIFPGAYYIDQLVMKRKIQITSDKVVGFNLVANEEDGFTIVVLYGLKANGELMPPQVSVNATELDLVIRDYAQTHQIEDFDPLLFSIEDVLQMPMGIGYPTEKMIGAVSANHVMKMSAVAIGAIALCSYAYSGFLYVSNSSLQTKSKQAQSREKAAKAQVQTVLKAQLPALAMANSIDFEKGINFSYQLNSPILKIDTLTINREKGIFSTDMTVFEATRDANSAGRLKNYSDIDSLLNQPLPEGLTRGKIIMGADGNAYKIDFEFQSFNSTVNDIVGTK